MKKVITAATLFALSCVLAMAQTTWNGLHFGMSVRDAQGVMAASKTVMFAADSQTLRSSKDFELQIGSAAYSFPMKVELRFNNTGLNMIVLALDIQELRRRKPDLTGIQAIMVFSSAAYSALQEKYGNPLNHQDECDPLKANDILSWDGCSADWSVNGQAIGYVAVAMGNADTALIQYNPISNAL